MLVLALTLAWNLLSASILIYCISTVLRKYLGLKIIGLTGSIATGKSSCAAYLTKHHYYIIDFDDISHNIYACGRYSSILTTIYALFLLKYNYIDQHGQKSGKNLEMKY